MEVLPLGGGGGKGSNFSCTKGAFHHVTPLFFLSNSKGKKTALNNTSIHDLSLCLHKLDKDYLTQHTA